MMRIFLSSFYHTWHTTHRFHRVFVLVSGEGFGSGLQLIHFRLYCGYSVNTLFCMYLVPSMCLSLLDVLSLSPFTTALCTRSFFQCSHFLSAYCYPFSFEASLVERFKAAVEVYTRPVFESTSWFWPTRYRMHDNTRQLNECLTPLLYRKHTCFLWITISRYVTTLRLRCLPSCTINPVLAEIDL